jgi:hypothetical protein
METQIASEFTIICVFVCFTVGLNSEVKDGDVMRRCQALCLNVDGVETIVKCK